MRVPSHSNSTHELLCAWDNSQRLLQKTEASRSLTVLCSVCIDTVLSGKSLQPGNPAQHLTQPVTMVTAWSPHFRPDKNEQSWTPIKIDLGSGWVKCRRSHLYIALIYSSRRACYFVLRFKVSAVWKLNF